MKRRRKNEIVEGFMPAFTIAGASIGASVIGGAINSKIPAGMKNPLTTTGSTLGKFVAPIAGIGVMNITLKQLNKIKRRKY